MKQTVKGTCHVICRDRYGNIIEEYDETYETEVVSSRFDNYYRTLENLYTPKSKALWSNGHYYQCVDEENGIWERTR